MKPNPNTTQGKESIEINSWSDLHKFSDALKKITDDPEGGELRMVQPSGKILVFSMPPKDKRRPNPKTLEEIQTELDRVGEMKKVLATASLEE